MTTRGVSPRRSTEAPRRRSRVHKIALLAAASLLIAACADVIGATDYRDAVVGLCGDCKDALPDCTKRLTQSLATSKDSDVADWLGTYVELGCDNVACNSPTVLECFYSAPGVCTPLGGACAKSAECCKFDFDDARKGSGCCADGDSGDGKCCDACLTCAEAIGVQMPDVSTVCLSHREALDAVVNCRNTTCKVACATTKVACDACVAKDCKAQANACNDNKAP